MIAEASKGLDGRRQCLQSNDFSTFPDTAHVGLWIDKFLPHQEKGAGQKKADHFEQAACSSVSGIYEAFFDRWKKSLAEADTQTHRATVQGRLAIGLGGESVLETAISLHRTYGVPYIPGSAIKGLAAHYARNRLDDMWKKKERAKGADGKLELNPYTILFGDTDIAGYVTFYDALYIPGSSKEDKPLALDVINVHHPDYYGGKDVPPADWDSPTPVSFLSTTGSYLIALGGPKDWVDAAFKILACALHEEGIGAKTSSGYGRMVVDGVEYIDTTVITDTKPAKTVAPKPLPPNFRRGVVKSFGLGDNKSYGYIGVEGSKDVFVHRDDLTNNLQTLEIGQTVVFHLVFEKGKAKAKDVRLDK